jgi:tetratricopeptide (TPR) repeat protein/transglutaminase-like putative cysteine protease
VQKPDGRVIERNDLKPEDVNPFGVSGLPVPADLRIRKVTVPGLEPGDRLSYRIVLRQRPLAPNRIFGEMKFNPLVSDPLQVYELDLPRAVPINVKLRDGLGATWEDVPAPADRLVRRLSVRAPRPKPGADRPTEAELKVWTDPDVVFTNFDSWDDVGQWWWALSKDRLLPDGSVRAEAARLVAGKTTPKEKLEAVHAFVASRIRYLSVGFGIGRMQPRAAPEVLSSRFEDCKDKHALLEALAAAAGLEVRPVLVHSVRKDVTSDAPSPQQFDHMISVARLGTDPAGWLWMDSTNSLGPPGYLTRNLRDKPALLIEAGGKSAVVRTPVDPPFTARTDVQGRGSLDAAGLLRARMRWTFRSDGEVMLRALFAGAPKDRHAEGVKRTLARSWKDGEVSNVTFADPADVSTPFWIEFDVEKTAPDRRSDKDWELWVPLPDFELPEPRKEAAGQDKAAEFEVREFTAQATIELPAGTKARAPLSVSLERPFGQFRSAYAVEGNRLRVERTLKLARGSVAPAELAAYESFRKALDTDREQDFLIGALAEGSATAETLHAEGEAARQEKNYDRAVELLRKAAEKDAKRKDVWNDLGRALRDKGDKPGAIEAFAKQIENDPFDEFAYAERAHVLSGLDRWEEAEKDLLKQVEVAPFKAWSYTKLAERRFSQGRFKESAEHYARAATLEPKVADHWIDLAWTHLHGGRAEEARPALAQARSLELKDYQQVSVARALSLAGDGAAAAEIAARALPSIAQHLASLSAADFDKDDLFWSARLTEVWQLIGAAAVTAGDLAKAEKYLQAAWRTTFQPEAAWSLALLRERQQKPGEAARWFSAAESLAGADWRLPEGYAARAQAARKKAPPDSPGDLAMTNRDPVMANRVIKLFDKPAENLDEEVLVLVGGDGSVESMKNLTRKNPAAFERQMARLGRPKLGLPRPDPQPVKLVLSGLLSCFKLTTCSLVLDIPGAGSIAGRN